VLLRQVRRKRPVWDCSSCAISSGVPSFVGRTEAVLSRRNEIKKKTMGQGRARYEAWKAQHRVLTLEAI